MNGLCTRCTKTTSLVLQHLKNTSVTPHPKSNSIAPTCYRCMAYHIQRRSKSTPAYISVTPHPKSILVTSHNTSHSQSTCYQSYQNAHLAYHIQRLLHLHDLTYPHRRVTPHPRTSRTHTGELYIPHPRTISYLLQVAHAATIIKCMNNKPHISMTKGRLIDVRYVSAKCQASSAALG